MHGSFSKLKISIYFIGAALVSSQALAQSSLLGLSSGRYEVRKAAPTSAQKRKPASVDEGASTEVIQSPVASSDSQPAVSAKLPAEVKPQSAPPVQQLESKAQDYAATFDTGKPRLEFTLGSLLIANESESNSSLREYKSLLQALQVQGRFWISEQVAIEGQILNSLNGNITDSSADQTQTPLNFEEMKLSLIHQNSFEAYNRVRFNLSYLDSKYKLSSMADAKLGHQSSGLGFGISFLKAESSQFNWTFATEIFPRLSHQENSGLSGAHSGSAPQSSRVDISVGGEYHLNPRSVVIWGLDYNYTKNLFEGPASAADPLTSVVPENVSVDQTSLIFRLGYRWGR